MAKTRRSKMQLRSVFIVLVLSVVAESCDDETQYMEGDQCCNKCEPGKRMLQNSDCVDPVCQDCEDGEYQDEYTDANLCKRQPSCDRNLNLISQAQSKTKVSPCVCIPDHHCSDTQCDSCVRNRECQPGEKISKNGSRMEDTECEPCRAGTFSTNKSAFTCKPWTPCPSGFKEVSPGSSTSDRSCEELPKNAAVIVPVLLILLILAGAGLCIYFYKKAKTGSISFVQKLLICKFCATKNTHQPAQDNADVENGPPQQPVNQPQEDTEDLVKLETPLSPGVSENGMPVIQDHSKSLLLSENETEPESCSVHF